MAILPNWQWIGDHFKEGQYTVVILAKPFAFVIKIAKISLRAHVAACGGNSGRSRTWSRVRGTDASAKDRRVPEFPLLRKPSHKLACRLPISSSLRSVSLSPGLISGRLDLSGTRARNQLARECGCSRATTVSGAHLPFDPALIGETDYRGFESANPTHHHGEPAVLDETGTRYNCTTTSPGPVQDATHTHWPDAQIIPGISSNPGCGTGTRPLPRRTSPMISGTSHPCRSFFLFGSVRFDSPVRLCLANAQRIYSALMLTQVRTKAGDDGDRIPPLR